MSTFSEIRLTCAATLLTLGGRVEAAPESPEALIESPLSTSNLVETGLGLVVVLCLVLAIAWMAKRFVQVPGIGKGQIQILGGVSLGTREKAVLLAVDGKRLLVGVAPGRVQTLAELDGEAAPALDFARQFDAASGRNAETKA